MRHSIIVPVYNEVKNISKCLDSIIAQTDKDWECWVIDDGSTDGSGRICDAYAKKDKRFHVEHTKNRGLGAARNLGIEKSSGDYICFLDSDDWIEENKLQRCYEAAQKSGSSIIWHSMNIIEGNKTKQWYSDIEGTFKYDDKRLLSTKRYDFGHSTDKLYKRDLIINHKIKFPTGQRFEDAPFSFKAFFHAGSMYKIKDALYNYQRSGTATLSKVPLTVEDKIKIIHSHEDVVNEFRDTDKHEIVSNFIDVFLSSFFNSSGKDTIDYVFPYVDNTDAEWLKVYNAHVSKKKRNDINSIERYRAHENMLKYKFRSIAENLPWIGVVHFVVSSKSQVPKWIDQSKVHVVLHEDIIPAEFLPTFNSSTIMLFLQNILGLSERYLVSNDDMYPNNRVGYNDFFRGNKLMIKTSTSNGCRIGPNEEMYKFTFYNAYKTALEKYTNKKHTVDTYYKTQHIDTPMFRSAAKKLFDENQQVLKSSVTKFRDYKNINEYFYFWGAKFKGLTEEGHLTCYVNNITEVKLPIYRKIIPQKTYQYVCINDAENTTEKTYSKLSDIFSARYPKKCKYEKGSDEDTSRQSPQKKYTRVYNDSKRSPHLPKEVRHFYEL